MPKKSKSRTIDKEDVLLLLGKGKKGIWRIFFSRTTFIFLMFAIQAVIVFLALYKFSEYLLSFFVVSLLISSFMIVKIVNSPSNPAVKITWISIFALFPALAILFYVYIENDVGFRLVKSNLSDILMKTRKYMPNTHHLHEEVYFKSRHLYNLSSYMEKYGYAPIYENAGMEYFPSGEKFFERLIEELQKAEKFIFIETFIISEGYMWGRILKILKEKAEAGVEVSVLYDGTCAFTNLPYGYPHQLSRLKIKCKMFSPILPFVSSHYNNRDHRKIVIVDGHTAFTGGVNLADEYINMKTVHGHWKDAGLMFRGSAVKSFTLLFLQMWNIGEKNLDYDKFMNTILPPQKKERGYIIPYGDSPLDSELVGEAVYLDIINNAEDYVYIMTPYLILDHEIITALGLASKRGVDVRIIMPHKPDKKTIFMLSRSYYRELMNAGVKIYEYLPGFVHSKVFVSDDMRAVVGTINLDYRSFYHHFECGCYFYDSSVIQDIEADFQRTLEDCQEVTMEYYKKLPLYQKLIGTLFKLIAPLM